MEDFLIVVTNILSQKGFLSTAEYDESDEEESRRATRTFSKQGRFREIRALR